MAARPRCAPGCGIDSVIGDRNGYAVTLEFLGDMEAHWLGVAD